MVVLNKARLFLPSHSTTKGAQIAYVDANWVASEAYSNRCEAIIIAFILLHCPALEDFKARQHKWGGGGGGGALRGDSDYSRYKIFGSEQDRLWESGSCESLL